MFTHQISSLGDRFCTLVMEVIVIDMDIVKEHQTMEAMFGPQLKDQVMKITPMQKYMRERQRMHFNTLVIIGDCNNHVNLGIKCSKEVATVIHGVLFLESLAFMHESGGDL
ncbi:hypothetical protein SUGI_0094280 [Cryptomeria japonica]|nr:hypothetical protein SUGI_0094280 [Cryptomeria japonica]